MKSFLCGLLGFILGVSVCFAASFYLRVIPFSDTADRKEMSEGLRKVTLLVAALRDYESKAYDFKNLPHAPKDLMELVDGGFLSARDYQDATTGLRIDYFGSPDEDWGRDGIVVVGHGRGFAVYGSKSGNVAVREIKQLERECRPLRRPFGYGMNPEWRGATMVEIVDLPPENDMNQKAEAEVSVSVDGVLRAEFGRYLAVFSNALDR